jgi:hypothetical protein
MRDSLPTLERARFKTLAAFCCASLILGFVESHAAVFAATAPPVTRAVSVTQAANDATGLTVHGTITNGFSLTQNAECGSSSFLLFGNGKVFQGVAQCDSSAIGPGAKIKFLILFPTVAPGMYHLRFERLHDAKYRYEMAPVVIGTNLPNAAPTSH